MPRVHNLVEPNSEARETALCGSVRTLSTTLNRPLFPFAILAFCLLSEVVWAQPKSAKVEPILKDLPGGWKVSTSFELTPDQVRGIGQKFAVKINRISNSHLNTKGGKLQVNVVELASDADARKLYEAFLRLKSDRRMLQRDGLKLYELISRDLRLIIEARYRLGIQPRTVKYKVSFDAAPIATCNYMSWNRVYQCYLGIEAGGQQAQEARKTLAQIRPDFTFDQSFRLRRLGLGEHPSTWSLPNESHQKVENRDVVLVTAAKLQDKVGLPSAHVTGTVTSETFGRTAAKDANLKRLTSATPKWPANDAQIKALVQRITRSETDAEGRSRAILHWLMPGRNVKFGGNVVGSRYGVPKVLEQKFGHCWDFSDCYITLCRASGIPCRQVAGWLYGVSGHVWAEVLIDGQWRQVDPTTAMECGSDYVPYLISEDGELSLVYVSSVTIEVLN